MLQIPVFNAAGTRVGVYELEIDEIAEDINKQLLHDAVVMYQANKRQGTSQSKTRGQVAGAKKKMYRQKGTGNARAGHRRSGVRRGGGHIFAKQPRDWSYRLPRKALQLATRMAVASKINDSQITLVDGLSIATPKTKEMVAVLKNLKIAGTVLVAIEAYDANLYKSFRNIEGVRILPLSDLNAFEILRPRRLLMTKAALESFVSSVPKKREVEAVE